MRTKFVILLVFVLSVPLMLLLAIQAQSAATTPDVEWSVGVGIHSVPNPFDRTLSASPSSEWNKTYGTENGEQVFSAIQTSDGGYALLGTTMDPSPPGPYADFWFVKTDSSGNIEWSRSYGREYDDLAHSVIQTSDGGYLLAGSTAFYSYQLEDVWLIKTDSSGNMEWSKTLDWADPDVAYSVIRTSDGGFALAGYTEAGAGLFDILLVKTDSSGNMEWSKTFGGTGFDDANSVIQTSDGGYILAGSTQSYGAGGYDAWLIKTDSSGNKEWDKTFGGTWGDMASSVIQTSDGGYALAGYTDSHGVGWQKADFWLIKTDSSGNKEWDKNFGGSSYDYAYSVIQTSDGGFALAGCTESYGVGWDDVWLVKTDPSGNMEWSKTFGGENYDEACSVIQTSDGGYVIAGQTGGDFWLIKTFPPSPEEEVPSEGLLALPFPWWWLLLIYFLISLILAVWVYRDSKGRRMNRGAWAGATFLTSFVGLAVYLKKRKPRRRG